MSKHDDAFLRTFGSIMVGLIIFTVVIVILARGLTGIGSSEPSPNKRANIEKRIAPVADVRVGAEGQAALEAAQQEQVAAMPIATPGAAVDGEQVYNSVCMVCHAAGVAGAPVTGSDDMQQRLAEKGLETLVYNAINGINAMPPRGGRPDLSDEQVQASVEFMLPQ